MAEEQGSTPATPDPAADERSEGETGGASHGGMGTSSQTGTGTEWLGSGPAAGTQAASGQGSSRPGGMGNRSGSGSGGEGEAELQEDATDVGTGSTGTNG